MLYHNVMFQRTGVLNTFATQVISKLQTTLRKYAQYIRKFFFQNSSTSRNIQIILTQNNPMSIAQVVGKKFNQRTNYEKHHVLWVMGLMGRSGGHFALLLYHLWEKLNHLVYHKMKTHTKNWHFKCKLWYKGFAQIVKLKRHFVNHMDKKFSPASCVPDISGFRLTWNAKS